MALKPGILNPPGDIEFSDGRSKKSWVVRLDGGLSAVQISTKSDDVMAIYVTDVGKKFGDFDEQRSWIGGRGREFFNDDATGYFDAKDCWTLSDHQLTPAPQWYWSSGYRNADFSMPGSVIWMSSVSGGYISRSFVASASYNADYGILLIRRRGNPGTLTFELRSDNGGNPGTVLQTVTKTTTDITDIISIYTLFDWTGVQALTSATTYHIVVYGVASDNPTNHWEFACSATGNYSKTSPDNSAWTAQTWSMYFRVCEADVAGRRWFMFHFNGKFYAVDSPSSGTSVLMEWQSGSSLWSPIATTGLTIVKSCPVVFNNIVYFPQGEATLIRKWNGTNFLDETGNYASFLCIGADKTAGPQIFKANNAAAACTIARAPVQGTWASALVFGTAINVGDVTWPITGMTFFQNMLWVAKQESIWNVNADVPIPLEFGIKSTPNPANGVAIVGQNQYLYFSWLFSTERVYNGVVDDIGLGWRLAAPPMGREAFDSWYEPYVGWLFIAKDAGSGTSSIGVWDGLVYHELIRGFAAGKRIQCVKFQYVSGGRTRMWFDVGGDLCYFEMPLNKSNPYNDTGAHYMHEGVMVSSIIDMGTASRIPKYIIDLTAMTENLITGVQVDVDYHVDDDCGHIDGISYWKTLQSFVSGPENIVDVAAANIRKFQYRLRLQTNNNLVPPIIRGIIPNGFARSTFRTIWSIRISVGDIIAPDGSKPVNPEEFYSWLMEVAQQPRKIRMTSVHNLLHNKNVIIAPPTTFPKQRAMAGTPSKDVMTLSIMEM
jgi:hypothetical protein